MPTTPVLWNTPTIANVSTNAVETEVVALTNGNFAVVWRETDDLGEGIASGHDIVGRIYNPLGEPQGEERLLEDLGDAHLFGKGGLHKPIDRSICWRLGLIREAGTRVTRRCKHSIVLSCIFKIIAEIFIFDENICTKVTRPARQPPANQACG